MDIVAFFSIFSKELSLNTNQGRCVGWSIEAETPKKAEIHIIMLNSIKTIIIHK